ncbi:MAG: hypothetical protein ACR2M0_14145 [Chloroflexia bacterium]
MRQEGRYLWRSLMRPHLWALIGLALLSAALAYQVRRGYDIAVGEQGDALYLSNFHAPVQDDSGHYFRSSDVYGFVNLPGLGGGTPYSVTLGLNRGSSDVPITVIINGQTFADGKIAPGWHTYTFAVDALHPQALASRDLVIEIRAPGAGGIMLDRAAVGAPGPGLVVPALAQLAYLAAILLLVFLLLARFGYARRGEAVGMTLPLGGATLVGLLLVLLLAVMRLPTTVLMPALLVALLASHILLAPALALARRLVPEGRILARLLLRPAIWLILVLTLLGGVAAYQVRHSYDIDIGSPSDQAYVQNFQDRQAEIGTGRDYRPSGVYSYITLPGVGGDLPFTVSLTLKPGEPNAPATVIINGTSFLRRRLNGDWQTLDFRVDPAHPRALASRDLVIELRTSSTSALLLDRVRVGAQGAGFVSPSYGQLADLAAIVLLVYLLLGRALAGLRREAWVSTAGAALEGLVLLGLLAWLHLPLTVATAHLALTGLLTYCLLVLGEAAARRLVPASDGAARAAGVLFAAAFLLRFGLMALPESVIIDMPYHMKWMRELLNGNIAALTDTHGGLNEPPKEWGLAVLIPKSPLFYFAAAPLALLPGDLETAIKALVCLLESSVVLFCYFLLGRFAPSLGGPRAGLWAALAYATNPLGYRALAYGILPTILAQWFAIAFFSLQLSAVSRQPSDEVLRCAQNDSGGGEPSVVSGRWSVVGGQEATRTPHSALRTPHYVLRFALLTAALVAFPTIAVFTSIVLVGMALIWWRGGHGRRAAAAAGMLAGAWVVAVAVYYFPYISDLLTKTLPQLLGGPVAGAASTASTTHWSGPLDLLGWTLGYMVNPLPLLMGLTGLAALWIEARRTRGTPAERPEALLAALTAAWFAILPIFVIANYKVDMIGKHLFYTMVPLSLGSGIFLHLISGRGRAGRRLAVVIAVALALAGVAFWLERLVMASS